MNPDRVWCAYTSEHFQEKYSMWILGDMIQCMCMSGLCHIGYGIIEIIDGYK